MFFVCRPRGYQKQLGSLDFQNVGSLDCQIRLLRGIPWRCAGGHEITRGCEICVFLSKVKGHMFLLCGINDVGKRGMCG